MDAVQTWYLLLILKHDGPGDILSADLARAVGVSRAAAHRRVNQLIEAGLVLPDASRGVRLTEEGRTLATRRQALYDLLQRHVQGQLGLTGEDAHAACLQLVCGLSQEAQEKMVLALSR